MIIVAYLETLNHAHYIGTNFRLLWNPLQALQDFSIWTAKNNWANNPAPDDDQMTL